MQIRAFWIGLAGLSTLSLWMRTGFPVFDGGDAGYDDTLFVKLAGYLGMGEWLGPYNNLTLAKGMFYPLFVVIAFVTAIPLKVAEQGLYLGACVLTACFVFRRTGGGWSALILFVALAFNPVMWTAPLAHVLREGIYLSLALAFVVLTLGVVFPQAAESRRCSIATAIALGLVSGCYWLTREEGPWILPALFVVLAFGFLLRKNASIGVRFRPLMVALGAFVTVLTTVATLNAINYGVFRLTDFQSGSFVQAYGAISRIKPSSWQRYIVFPRESRERAYAVSPAASELQPSLEGVEAENWREVGCTQTATPDCPEVLSGWFMWELRNAVAQAGHYNSAREADSFYSRLAQELDDACDTGKLECLSPRASMLPPFKLRYLVDAIQPGLKVARLLFHLGDGQIGSPPSQGEDSIHRLYTGLMGSVMPKLTAAPLVIRGWAGSPAAKPTVYVAGGGDGDTTSSVELLNSRYVTQPLSELNKIRFVVTTNCPPDRCSLVVAAGDDQKQIPLNDIHSGADMTGPIKTFFEDGGFQHLRDKFGDASVLRRALQVKVATGIASIYRQAMPPLSILALVGAIAALLAAKKYPVNWPLAALAVSSGVAVLSRIGLLAYMDVSAIPGVNLQYASPASPFVIVFAVAGNCLALSVARAAFAQFRQRQVHSPIV